MRKFMVLTVLALIATLAVVACGKAPAEAALKAADEAIAAAKPEAERFVPDQFKSLTDAAIAARVKFDQGDYAGALAGAKDIPMQAKDVVAAAAAKKDELMASWKGLSEALPGILDGIKTKVADLTKARTLPKGLNKAKVASFGTGLEGLTATWTEATTAFQGGNLTGALAKATEVKSKAEALMAEMTPAPPAKPAGK